MRKSLILLSLISTAMPALSEGIPLERPADCVPTLTVQFGDCRVESIFSCGSESSAYNRTETVAAEGLRGILHETPDGLTIGYLFGTGEVLTPDPSRSRVTPIEDIPVIGEGESLLTAEVSVDIFNTTTRFPWVEKIRLSHAGQVEVSGDRLEVFDASVNLDFGEEHSEMTGKAYYHSAAEVLLFEGAKKTPDGAPFLILHPGEPGFDIGSPKFGCQEESSLASQETEVRA